HHSPHRLHSFPTRRSSDLVEQGGNCSLSEPGKTVVSHGVKIVGQTNLPSLLPVNASELFAKNISTLLLHLASGEGFKLDLDEEITKGCLITHEGQLVHETTRELLNKAAQGA